MAGREEVAARQPGPAVRHWPSRPAVIVAGLASAAGVCRWLACPPPDESDGTNLGDASAPATAAAAPRPAERPPEPVVSDKTQHGLAGPFRTRKNEDSPAGGFLESFRAREA